MGAGAVLKDVPASPVAALILAAGLSSRMSPQNKLLTIGQAGQAMIATVADAVLGSTASPVLVVTGHQADRVAAALAGKPVTLIHAAGYEAGLSASLRSGIAALPARVAGALICLGDMPLVTPEIIDQLLAAFAPGEGRSIIVPTCLGTRGNPVLWGRRFFADILALTGDSGARSLLVRHAAFITEVDVESPAVLTDFDTPESLATLA